MGSSRLRHLTHMASLGSETSPDGKILLTINEYGIRAWSLATGKLLYEIRDEYGFHRPTFSPDGKWLAVNRKEAIHLHDPATGRKLRQIPADGLLPGQPELLAFSGDSRRLVAGLHEGEILLFDLATGRQTAKLDAAGAGRLRGLYFMVFTDNGKTLLSVGRDSDSRDAICHWDVATQTLRKRVVPSYPPFRSTVALSPNGQLLAVPSGRGPVTLWETQTGQVRCTLQGEHNRATYGLAFSPDGKSLATAWAEQIERDATASLWDTATGKLRRRIRVPRTALVDLGFSADGRLLLTPGGCQVQLWDIVTGKEVLPQEAHTYGVTSLAFTPDGRSIISGGGETIRVWDASTGQQRQVMVAHRWYVNQVKVRPDGRTVVSCGADGTVCVHDLMTGKELRRCLVDQEPETLRDRGRQILWLGLSPDGRTASTVCAPFNGQSSFIHIWDLESGRLLTRRPNSGGVHAGLLSPDARIMVSPRQTHDLAGADGTASMGAGALAKGSGKGKMMAEGKVGAPEGPLRTSMVVREVTTGRELVALPQPDQFAAVMTFTPDSQCLLTTTFTPSSNSRPENQGPSTLRLWELATGKQRLAITSAAGGYDHDFAQFAVAPDGRTLATVRSDHIIQLWDLATGKELLRRKGHDTPAYCMAFSPDGRRLVTGHGDSAILLWDVAPAYERRPRRRPAEAHELETWWRDLAGDAPQAHHAIWSLADVPEQAVSILRGRLRPAVALPADTLRGLVQDLDSSRFPRREEAMRRLAEFGEDAEPTLRQALADKPSAEARQRLERILAGPLRIRSPELLRSLRAIQVLEAIGDDSARRLLGGLTEGAPASAITRQARAALDRLAHR
jgi:WD40 repeat protein